MKQTYLNELTNNGYIDEDDSQLDHRKKIFFPLLDISAEEKVSNYNNDGGMDNLLQYSKILPPKNCRKIPDNWLNIEILKLWKYPVPLEKFELMDETGNETCICQFVKQYEKNAKLDGFFRIVSNDDNCMEVFGNLKFIGCV